MEKSDLELASEFSHAVEDCLKAIFLIAQSLPAQAAPMIPAASAPVPLRVTLPVRAADAPPGIGRRAGRPGSS